MFSSLEWSLPNTWINMNMPDVWKPFNGSVSFVLLRHQTRWGLKCSTLVMGSSTLMVLTKRSGCVAINAKRLSICPVLLKRKKKISNSPSCAGSMSVGSNPKFKRVGVGLKRVIKQVTFLFLVVRQKTTVKKIRRVKTAGSSPPPHKKASAGQGSKEQLWKVEKTRNYHQKRSSPWTKSPRWLVYPTLHWMRGSQADVVEVVGARSQVEKRTAKVLKAGKFKWVTLTDFKQVMIRGGNRLLDHLCNPPLPLFLP